MSVISFRESYSKWGSKLTLHALDAHILSHEPFSGN